MKECYRFGTYTVVEIYADTKSEAIAKFGQISLKLPKDVKQTKQLEATSCLQITPRAWLKTIGRPESQSEVITLLSLRILVACIEEIELAQAIKAVRTHYEYSLQEDIIISNMKRLIKQKMLAYRLEGESF